MAKSGADMKVKARLGASRCDVPRGAQKAPCVLTQYSVGLITQGYRPGHGLKENRFVDEYPLFMSQRMKKHGYKPQTRPGTKASVETHVRNFHRSTPPDLSARRHLVGLPNSSSVRDTRQRPVRQEVPVRWLWRPPEEFPR